MSAGLEVSSGRRVRRWHPISEKLKIVKLSLQPGASVAEVARAHGGLSVRQTRATPLLDDLRRWMEKTLRSLSSKSETAAAILYTLSRWRALTRYTDDGLLEIDNSAAERALRAVALGRKNCRYAYPSPALNSPADYPHASTEHETISKPPSPGYTSSYMSIHPRAISNSFDQHGGW